MGTHDRIGSAGRSGSGSRWVTALVAAAITSTLALGGCSTGIVAHYDVAGGPYDSLRADSVADLPTYTITTTNWKGEVTHEVHGVVSWWLDTDAGVVKYATEGSPTKRDDICPSLTLDQVVVVSGGETVTVTRDGE